MIIASKKMYFNDSNELKVIIINLYKPLYDQKRGWGCKYEILWPDEPRFMTAYGFSEFQAIFIAMQMIGAEIYISDYHEAGLLHVDGQEKGYGFPVPKNCRELLVGADIEMFG